MDDQYKKLLTGILLTLLALASIASADDLIFNPPPSLFTDKRAFRTGDVVTILLQEYTTGTNASKFDSEFKNQFEFGVSASGHLSYLPGQGLQASVNSDNQNRGSTSRTGTMTGKIAAMVTEILENSNLRLEGRRAIKVNGETQITVITGVVRPVDIRADNTIYSYMIADAEISFIGDGEVDDSSKPGIISRFLAWLF